jgi:hypothetical protein
VALENRVRAHIELLCSFWRTKNFRAFDLSRLPVFVQRLFTLGIVETVFSDRIFAVNVLNF